MTDAPLSSIASENGSISIPELTADNINIKNTPTNFNPPSG